jgi:hypothetical protein
LPARATAGISNAAISALTHLMRMLGQ